MTNKPKFVDAATYANAVNEAYRNQGGKAVYSENLGHLGEGVYTRNINCQNLPKGMYLVNVIIGGQRATSKLVVR